jgi:hypothetical protein
MCECLFVFWVRRRHATLCVTLSEAKHLWIVFLARRGLDDQRFFASLRMTEQRTG